MTDSKFTRCKIVECDFTKAIVTRMSMQDSDIRTSSIDGIDVLAVDLKNAKIDLEQCVIIAEAMGAKYKP